MIMADRTTGTKYYKRLSAVALDQFKWGWDLLIATVMALATWRAQVHYDLLPQNKRLLILATIIAPYGIVFVLHLAWRYIIVAPQKLHQQLEMELRSTEDLLRQKDNALHNAARQSRSSDWTELAAKFEKLSRNFSANLQIDHEHGAITHYLWTFSGSPDTRPLKTLCRYAGNLLLKSPTLTPMLNELTRGQTDEAWRWLFYMKENYDVCCAMDYMHSIPTENGYFIEIQSIRDVAAVSARICTECAAREL